MVHVRIGMSECLVSEASPIRQQMHARARQVVSTRAEALKQYSAEEKIRIVDLALDEPELSPRELAVKFTDTKPPAATSTHFLLQPRRA